MRLKISRDDFKAIQLEDIELFENKIGYKLPVEYHKFLIENNGAICDLGYLIHFKELNKCQNISTEKEHKEISSKCLKKHKFGEEPEFYERTALFWQVLSLEKLTVNEDENNSERKYICFLWQIGDTGAFLSLNEDTFGQIYWCDPIHEGKYFHISNTLEEFLNSFEENPNWP